MINMAKVKVISIGYTTAFDECAVKLSVWPQDFESKQKAIDWLNEKHGIANHPLVFKINHALHELGCATVDREHFFILYHDEQKQWIKTLVKELI